MKFFLALAIVCSLFILGCSQDDKEIDVVKKTNTAKVLGEKEESSKSFADKISATIREKGGALVEKAAVSTGSFSEKAKQQIEAAKEKAEELSVQLEETAGKVEEVAIAVQEQGEKMLDEALVASGDLGKELEQTVEVGKQKVAEISENAQKIKQNITTKADETIKVVNEELKKNVESAKDSAGNMLAVVTAPVNIILDNKKGKITFPHKQHSDKFDCSACHVTKTPGPFEIGKKKGHALCKGCHNLKKTGPIKCNGCHLKKDV